MLWNHGDADSFKAQFCQKCQKLKYPQICETFIRIYEAFKQIDTIYFERIRVLIHIRFLNPLTHFFLLI